LVAVAAMSGRACAQTAAEGVLVLRNGHVLAGAVRRLGDVYRIETSGATLQVPAAQVDMFAPTLGEAYETRRRQRVGDSADSHVELARWCLQVGLIDEAARELLDARRLEPGHRGAAIVELQVRQFAELDALHRAPPAAPRNAPSATGASPSPAAGAADDAEPPIGISAAAQVQFVRNVQPMLVRSCATGGCHQPGAAQQLQLDRWALAGNGNAQLLRRNLMSALRHLNIDDPPASPLVAKARTMHGQPGGAKSRALNARQSAILLEWVNLAAGREPAMAPMFDLSSAAGVDGGVMQAAYEQSLDGDAEFEAGGPPRKLAAEFQPRDPFDPEIFNRRLAALAETLDAGEPADAVTAAAGAAELAAPREPQELQEHLEPPAEPTPGPGP
jgi:hypothetical protein